MAVEVRTRFAPSPTGQMHIGNLRTALYEYLIAKSHNGSFILRIEDTDRKRYVEGALDTILKTLDKTGLCPDEGPGIGGDYGPYIQSKRKSIYPEYAEKLIERGEAYYCFCSTQRLSDLKQKCEKEGRTFRYDRHCMNLSENEIEYKLSNNEPYVIRQKMPDDGVTVFEDSVYGTIKIENKELEDQILIKSDGMPTYNFAHVVDDHLMKITHVIRGSEYLTSVPKYNLLYKAFGWDIPIYVHLPLITKGPGQKISKRAGDTGFKELISKGYLPEAIINHVALLGWSPGTNQEIFSLSELENTFKIKGISKSPAIFDYNKLNWINGEYIRKMSCDQFHEKALHYYKKVISSNSIDLKKISKILQKRVEVLSEIPEKIDFIEKLPDYDISLFKHKRMKTNAENSLENLKAAITVLKGISDWNEQKIHDELINLVKKTGIKNGQMFWPVRTALTGKRVSPGGALEIADILGKQETIRRLETSIIKLKQS